MDFKEEKAKGRAPKTEKDEPQLGRDTMILSSHT